MEKKDSFFWFVVMAVLVIVVMELIWSNKDKGAILALTIGSVITLSVLFPWSKRN